ncbi:DM13 domain-containing protein [Virgisporangium ochraceum]
MTRALRSPLAWVSIVVVGVLAVAGLYWFQPWKLVTDEVVDEALPAVVTSSGAATATPTASATAAPTTTAPAANRVLAAGDFISHEHETRGSAEIVRLANGGHQLVLRGLDTSNGPDLRVWLTDQPVIDGTAGWRVFDDGRWVEVAKLKGNKGDQVYDLPASVDLATTRSVTIWCKRFSVSFGAAELKSA